MYLNVYTFCAYVTYTWLIEWPSTAMCGWVCFRYAIWLAVWSILLVEHVIMLGWDASDLFVHELYFVVVFEDHFACTFKIIKQ